ncbi:MAG: hypothetical protein JNK79_10825 [Chitinophagaceae bacterium]|nr:hypothetical protein [Chitinophagaceae bacterium]
MSNEPSITWKADGATLARPSDIHASIPITEYQDSFTMADAPGPYGIPIDAPLAVSMIKALRELVQKQPPDSILRQLLEGSPAITLDKSVLLKTISQPKCEGIRFYPCLKKGVKGEDVLSLVTVGVDEKGADLLYEYKEGTQVQDIQTRSLLAEYGYPPGRLSTGGSSLDPFVLFKFSQ